MIKNLLVIVSLFFSLNLSGAEQISCGPTIQGGVDIFPWSHAQPFPWTKIQGLWLVEGKSDLVIKMRVIRQTARLRQLKVEIYSREDICNKPQISGVGLITAAEKNVVRIKVDNRLILLGMFTSEQLEVNPEACGQQVVAISMIDLISDTASRVGVVGAEKESQNMVLKKITSSVDLYCKKQN